MCGIVGAIAERDVTPILIAGLKRLEYRGYDSAGIAVHPSDQPHLQRLRAEGKVEQLEARLANSQFSGPIGIAHTRWATHGRPCEVNAHPHMSGPEIALVHNGIIENFIALRASLDAAHYQFESETDTEIIVHLIHYYLEQGNDLLAAVRATTERLEGAFALAVISSTDPDRLIAVRSGSPLVIGLGIGENFLASDQLALLPVTQQFIYLHEGDLAEIKRKEINIFNQGGQAVERTPVNSTLNLQETDRGQHRHFMMKEILEQPQVIADTLEERLTNNQILSQAFGFESEAIFSKVKHVQIVACGTSYHAGLIARTWIEELAQLPCQVDIASEYRYRKILAAENTLFVTISQSGETADTLAALHNLAPEKYLASLTICNVPESALARGSQLSFLTRAGVEIGVASTKAFTTQLTSLLMLATVLARYHQPDFERHSANTLAALRALPKDCAQMLNLDARIAKLAEQFSDKQHTLFLGRGQLYPVAMEGALKLKEISYIHAEAYPAGELKHGPLALVDQNMPVVAVAPNDQLLEKLKSNLYEVKARGGQLIVFADPSLNFEPDPQLTVIKMPININPLTAPILFTIPLQLLAYHVAVLKGTDVDQPRNLAKSVTVE